MNKIPDNDYKVIEKYVEEHDLDIAKITHITDTNKYILHPESSDDIIIDVTNGQAKRTDLGESDRCKIIAKRKRLGIQKGQCTDCGGDLPHGEEIGMCRPCAVATWGDR